jgi:hypothetical protein
MSLPVSYFCNLPENVVTRHQTRPRLHDHSKRSLVSFCALCSSQNLSNQNLSMILLADTELLNRAATDIQKNFAYNGVDSFKPAWVFVATWENASFNGADPVSYLLSMPVMLLTFF